METCELVVLTSRKVTCESSLVEIDNYELFVQSAFVYESYGQEYNPQF